MFLGSLVNANRLFSQQIPALHTRRSDACYRSANYAVQDIDSFLMAHEKLLGIIFQFLIHSNTKLMSEIGIRMGAADGVLLSLSCIQNHPYGVGT